VVCVSQIDVGSSYQSFSGLEYLHEMKIVHGDLRAVSGVGRLEMDDH
jgi:hypothetical protein